MAKVSVIIPARNERYLIPTVDDVLSKASGEVEVVAVLEDFGKAGITPTPDDWKAVQERHGPRLSTVYHHDAKGMRPAINAAAASAISRGAKYLFKLDAHCMLDEGWDEKLKADCDVDWVVVPRRKRLDPKTWTNMDVGKPDVDYHYLSFPDDPHDFGGKSLNGKVWNERIRERLGKPEYDIDSEMSSQGSGWFMHADYFQLLELMDHANYGQFWSEFQEIGMKCWLSGGRVVVNKKTWYSHWHKGKEGRGYRMPESWLTQGATFSKNWIWNDAAFNHKQTRPFEWLIDHFWPVPTWPNNWREVLYAERKPRTVGAVMVAVHSNDDVQRVPTSLRILQAFYGPTATEIDVTERVRQLVQGDTLDLMVGNTVLEVGNPYRGQKKRLKVVYSFDGQQFDQGSQLEKVTDERDWLIIGQSERWVKAAAQIEVNAQPALDAIKQVEAVIADTEKKILDMRGNSAAALNDFLIRKFAIPGHRLRGPMPIELRDFHRDDLAQLFAELGFNRGAEIGVAEGKYSEVLLKANPELSLLLVDPWGASEGNKQQKTPEKQLYAFNETKRKTQDYKHAAMMQRTSMEAVRDIQHELLDFVYLDANHSFDYVMQDLIEWSKRVRSGGIIAGDDLLYLDEKRWGAGPIEAVQAYVKAHRIPIWFICNAHRSVDYFWVRP